MEASRDRGGGWRLVSYSVKKMETEVGKERQYGFQGSISSAQKDGAHIVCAPVFPGVKKGGMECRR